MVECLIIMMMEFADTNFFSQASLWCEQYNRRLSTQQHVFKYSAIQRNYVMEGLVFDPIADCFFKSFFFIFAFNFFSNFQCHVYPNDSQCALLIDAKFDVFTLSSFSVLMCRLVHPRNTNNLIYLHKKRFCHTLA